MSEMAVKVWQKDIYLDKFFIKMVTIFIKTKPTELLAAVMKSLIDVKSMRTDSKTFKSPPMKGC